MPPGNHAHIRFFVDAGSCVTKVGVYAVRGNPVLLHNLKAFLKGEKLQDFDRGGDYFLIFNPGDGEGVFRTGTNGCKLRCWVIITC